MSELCLDPLLWAGWPTVSSCVRPSIRQTCAVPRPGDQRAAHMDTRLVRLQQCMEDLTLVSDADWRAAAEEAVGGGGEAQGSMSTQNSHKIHTSVIF